MADRRGGGQLRDCGSELLACISPYQKAKGSGWREARALRQPPLLQRESFPRPLRLLEVQQPPQTLPQAGSQVLKHMSFSGTFTSERLQVVHTTGVAGQAMMLDGATAEHMIRHFPKLMEDIEKSREPQRG